MRWTTPLALSAFLFAAAPTAAVAAEPAAAPGTVQELADVLKERYAAVKTLEAAVVQTTASAMGDTTMSGRVYLSRPGKGRWELSGGGFETLMVFDGAAGWLYTPASKQVIKMGGGDTDNALDPLALVASLNEDFDTTLVEGDASLYVVEAAPKAGTKLAGQYKQVRLEVARADLLPTRLTLSDNFGGSTDIRFSDAKVDGALKAELFQFTPPAGVEVVDGSL